MWDEEGAQQVEAFPLLHNALAWCRKYKLRVIVGLDILRSHPFNQGEKPLWNSSESQEDFIDLLRL